MQRPECGRLGGHTTANLIETGSSGLEGLTTWDVMDDLLDQTLAVSHGDTVTFTYDDKTSTATTDTAPIDLLKPAISNVSPTDDSLANDTTPLLTGQATDTGAGITTGDIHVYLDGAEVGLVSGEPIVYAFQISYTTAALAEGVHYWELRVADRVGNTARTGHITFIVDATQPTFSNSSLLDSAVTDESTPLLQTDVTDTGSEVDSDTIQITVDGFQLSKTVLAKDAIPNGFRISYTPDSLSDGAHSWSLKAWDRALNLAYSSTWAYTVDTGAEPTPTPVSTATSTPAPPDTIQPFFCVIVPQHDDVTNNSTPLLQADVTDEGSGVDLGAILLSLDNSKVSSAIVSKDPIGQRLQGLIHP